MTSTRIEASIQSQRAIHQTAYQGYPECHRRLSIAEIVERHCEGCDKSVSPKEVQEGRA